MDFHYRTCYAKLIMLNPNLQLQPETTNPADRFRVNPEDYPIFAQQSELDSHWGNNTAHTWNIDRTLSTYVTNTASLIATMDGTSTEYSKNHEVAPPDHVIYLDKSARPVSWLVNTLWDAFSDAARPDHSYLCIDRLNWFRASGIPVDQNGYFQDPSDVYRRAAFSDFQIDNLQPDTFAKIRALYLPDGITTEDPDTIMHTPSSLDGKNILIVDEVGNSGATLEIAKALLQRAIPEANDVRGCYFWKPGVKANQAGTETQLLSAPVWYNDNIGTGRGIGDINPQFYAQRYAEYPNAKTRAQNYGSIFLGHPIDLATEKDGTSRELMREIQQLHTDLDHGHILVCPPDNYTDDRLDALIDTQGLRFAPASDPSPDTYINVRNAINSRPAQL